MHRNVNQRRHFQLPCGKTKRLPVFQIYISQKKKLWNSWLWNTSNELNGPLNRRVKTVLLLHWLAHSTSSILKCNFTLSFEPNSTHLIFWKVLKSGQDTEMWWGGAEEAGGVEKKCKVLWMISLDRYIFENKCSFADSHSRAGSGAVGLPTSD